MRTAFGMHLPDLEAAWQLMFSEFRGMFFFAPGMLVLVPLWCAAPMVTGRRVLGLGLFACYWMLISSYFKWDGGWCTGPRHLLPVMALAMFEGLTLLARHPRWSWLFALLCLPGILVNLTAAATDALSADTNMRPFFTDFWPRVMKGEINPHNLAVELGFQNGSHLLWVWAGLFLVLTTALSWWCARTWLPSAASPPPAPVTVPVEQVVSQS